MEEALKIIEPIMLALKEIHESGFIHRDISPDNIMISDLSNRVYLQSLFHGNPAAGIIQKLAQGHTVDIGHNKIGRCITGIKPIDVTDRLFGDELKRPSEYGIPISPQIEDAIMKGLEIHNEDRFLFRNIHFPALFKISDGFLYFLIFKLAQISGILFNKTLICALVFRAFLILFHNPDDFFLLIFINRPAHKLLTII